MTGTTPEQRRPLTALALAVLALLTERPMHPYEMVQLMRSRRDDRLLKVRLGSVYHTVDRLCGDALVAVVGTDREGNRPERTTYSITAEGRSRLAAQLIELLAVPVAEYPIFPLALAEANSLPVQDVSTQLQRRIAAQKAHHKLLRDGLDSARARDVARRHVIEAEYELTMLQAEIDWLESLVTELDDGTLPWAEAVLERTPQ